MLVFCGTENPSLNLLPISKDFRNAYLHEVLLKVARLQFFTCNFPSTGRGRAAASTRTRGQCKWAMPTLNNMNVKCMGRQR